MFLIQYPRVDQIMHLVNPQALIQKHKKRPDRGSTKGLEYLFT